MIAPVTAGDMPPASADFPEVMTPEQTEAYLQLGAEGHDPAERRRTLQRRQSLPFHRKGRLLRFFKSEVDQWLRGELPARKGRGK